MKQPVVIVIVALVLGIGAGWILRDQTAHGTSPAIPAAGQERKPLFYQSAMHPWIKSDKPGRCTICGMQLTPVYDGQGADAPAGGLETDTHGNIIALTGGQVQVIGVHTSTAAVRPLARTLAVAGVVDDNDRRHRVMSAYVDGRVEKLFANHVGIEVTEGQPLANLYSPALLQAEREYRQLSGTLRKNTALRLRQMGLTDAQIAALPDKPADTLHTEILAPMSGTVVSRDVYEGQYVTSGQRLFEIADFSVMWFQFRAYETDLPWIRVGQSVQVTTASAPGKVFSGKVAFIDPNLDEATRSTNVRVEIPNPVVNGRRELLHKLYADGLVQLDAPEVLTIPRAAVIRTGAEAVVYIDKGNGTYARTEVKLGRSGDNLLEVLDGLQPGDTVVTEGNLLLDGQAEMNRTYASAPAPSKSAALTEEQRKATEQFIALAAAMSEALAADDLTAFNKASEPAMDITGSFVKAVRPLELAPDALAKLNNASHFHGFSEIAKAREAFHAFSMAATAAVQPLKNQDGAPPFSVWECPMVDEAVPGAAKKGRWLQPPGKPCRNPFFGKEMLECGQEVKSL
ncbi:hypothetical protein DB346_20980 [Verrucomicrobia bacterium LW23]|nr:hypothetical protein DB346_20980 [Verrucomicrobia bacterium LW23]